MVVDTLGPARHRTHRLCVTVRCQWKKKKDRLDADLWTGTFAHTGLKSNASNIHLFNNRRRFRAARAAFHAGFVPLCKDMSKHVKICRDAPRYVKICPDVSRYVKRCQDMSRDVQKVSQDMSGYVKICQDMSRYDIS